MKKLATVIAAAVLIGSFASTASAWSGPWGGNMFGMDMGQSVAAPAYYGAPVAPIAPLQVTN